MTRFRRYSPAMAAFYAACLQMAAWLGIVAASGQNPMPSISYGEGVSGGPVLAWVFAQIALSFIGLWGCTSGKPKVAAFGGLALGLFFVILTAAGFSAIPQGTPIAAMSFGAASLSFTAAWVSWSGHG